ncbi:DUF86 domain-containing protein [Microbacterium protaetiae]|uniref:DUF86 domain-containing protein n=1 Tax=Microbacterium protaetiae TaxID=2509458 RepID=A0A4P6ECV0_9MICO|nr:HepT-like ribonuclease domain-containing protein [Microbacterium protaetiae]QAY59476.1 DUF86 domain-containing protein [Microbacterium protaetiae]
MTDDGSSEATPFRAAPRSDRAASATHHERVDEVRAAIVRLGDLTVSDLDDRSGDTMLRVEAIIIRAAALVERLPGEVRDKLAVDDVRGLTGIRNVVAHGYGQLDPEITVRVIHASLPRVLDGIDAALGEG